MISPQHPFPSAPQQPLSPQPLSSSAPQRSFVPQPLGSSAPQRSFASQTSWLFGAQILSLLFGSVFGIVTARVLGPSGKGVLAIAMLIPGVLNLVFNLGIGIANTYFAGQGRFSPGDLAKNSLLAGLVLGVVAALIFIALLPVIGAKFFPNIGFGFLVLGAAMVPLVAVNEFLSAILLGLQRIKTLAVYRVGVSVLTLALLLALLSFRIWGALLSVLIASLFASLFLLFSLGQELKAKGQKPFFSVLGETVGYGVKGQAGNVLQFFNYRLDSFLVNYFLTPYYVGIYAVAVTVGELVWILPNTVAQALFARTSGESWEVANERTPRVFRFVLISCGLACMALGLLSKPVMLLLFGVKFAPSVLPLIWLLPGVFALSLAKIFSGDLNGRGRPYIWSFASLLALVVTVILDIVLIPRWGVVGAAFTSSVAYLLNLVVVSVAFIVISKVGWVRIFSFSRNDYRLAKLEI